MTNIARRLPLVIVFLSLLAFAQKPAPKKHAGPTTAGRKPSSWVVKPEWVRADEDFLASDALQGRGSASRDEQIAAEFVASQFESFGLQPGAPEKSFIERVELITPKLDGHAQLTAGDATLNESQDFTLISATGENTSGKLQKIAAADLGKTQIAPASVVLITGLPDNARTIFAATQRLRGASVITLLPESPSLKQMFQSMLGGKTRIPMHVQGGEAGAMGRGGNTVMVEQEAFAKLSALADGTHVSLAVHTVATPPNYTYNAIGVLEGTDPSGEAVLLSAHLDHLGMRANQSGDNIYNGADDDASGTTAIIELARALAAGPKPKRTVYFVCFGSEETGGQGDDYFRNNPPVSLNKFAANVEFEMIGAQDPKLEKGYVLLTGWERSNLGPTLKEHGAKVGADPYPEEHFFERSDNYGLALKGVVAHTAAGWGTPPYYHKADDDVAHLDFPFMTEVIQSFVAPLEWLINSDFRPQWNAGGQPKGR